MHLCLLLGAAQLKVLAALEHDLVRASALLALELQHNLLGRLDLCVQTSTGVSNTRS